MGASNPKLEELLGNVDPSPYEETPAEELVEGKDMAVLFSEREWSLMRELLETESVSVGLKHVKDWYGIIDAVECAIPLTRIKIRDLINSEE